HSRTGIQLRDVDDGWPQCAIVDRELVGRPLDVQSRDALDLGFRTHLARFRSMVEVSWAGLARAIEPPGRLAGRLVGRPSFCRQDVSLLPNGRAKVLQALPEARYAQKLGRRCALVAEPAERLLLAQHRHHVKDPWRRR